MSTTLALSAYPGDAAFSIGALLRALPGERHHLTCFRVDEAETLGFEHLGVSHAALDIPETASAKTVTDALAPHLDRHPPDSILLPLGLPSRAGEALLSEVLSVLKRLAPATRFLHYYDIPHVTQRKARYPELAFARVIRGLSEADADAAVFQWKARGTTSAAALEAKRAAALALRDELSRRLFPDPDLPPPTDEAELEALLHRALGTREWVQSA